jgi:hypothetical protein
MFNDVYCFFCFGLGKRIIKPWLRQKHQTHSSNPFPRPHQILPNRVAPTLECPESVKNWGVPNIGVPNVGFLSHGRHHHPAIEVSHPYGLTSGDQRRSQPPGLFSGTGRWLDGHYVGGAGNQSTCALPQRAAFKLGQSLEDQWIGFGKIYKILWIHWSIDLRGIGLLGNPYFLDFPYERIGLSCDISRKNRTEKSFFWDWRIPPCPWHGPTSLWMVVGYGCQGEVSPQNGFISSFWITVNVYNI